MTEPTDAEMFSLVEEHLGLERRRDDTVINRRTGRFHDAQRYRDLFAAVLAKWGQPAQAAEPVAWAATSEDGVVEALGMNQSRRFDTPLYRAPQSVVREPQWSPASTPPKESDGEVLVRMADGRCEIAWATYWHGSSNAFAQWTFRDPDEEETPVEWMLIPHGIKGGQHGAE